MLLCVTVTFQSDQPYVKIVTLMWLTCFGDHETGLLILALLCGPFSN